jgi:hypothetical protein
MLAMKQPQEQPVHWDSHRGKWNITLVVALIVAVVGLISRNPLLAILGIGFAAYSWFTSPRRYLIYAASLVIVYGTPRIKVIPFSEISHADPLSSPAGERLRLQLVNGRRFLLLARNSSEFRQRLDEALDKFRGTIQGGVIPEQGPDQPSQQGPDRPSPY